MHCRAAIIATLLAATVLGIMPGSGPAPARAGPDGALDQEEIQIARDILTRERERIKAGSIDSLPAIHVLRRNDPAGYERFKQRYARAAKNAADDDILPIARRVLRRSLRHLLAVSPPDVVLEVTKVSLAYMQALQSSNPESCIALVDEGKGAKLTSNLAREFPVTFIRDLTALELIAGTDPNRPVETISVEQATSYFGTMLHTLQQRQLNTGLLALSKLDPSEFASYCEVVIAFYKAALDLPDGNNVKVLRFLYAAAALAADDDVNGGGADGRKNREESDACAVASQVGNAGRRVRSSCRRPADRHISGSHR